MNRKSVQALVLLLACQGGAMAANMGFLSKTPMSRFNDQDNKMLQAAFQKAMNDSADGTTVEWKNDNTTSGGTITPIESFERQGAKCRKTKVTTEHKLLKNEGEYSFCKTSSGAWKMVQ
jgi:surface antigen